MIFLLKDHTHLIGQENAMMRRLGKPKKAGMRDEKADLAGGSLYIFCVGSSDCPSAADAVSVFDHESRRIQRAGNIQPAVEVFDGRSG